MTMALRCQSWRRRWPEPSRSWGSPPRRNKPTARCCRGSGQTLAAVAHGLERDPDELLAALRVFIDAGMVALDHGHVVVATPGEAVASLLQVQTQEMRRTADRIEELRGAIPTFPFFTADPDAQGEPLGGELRTG